MGIGGSKSGSTTVNNSTTTSTPTLNPAQIAQINAQTNLLTGTVAPSFQQAVTGATNLYNQEASGVSNAAQNYGATAGQAQQVLGNAGQSAAQTGIAGLENVFNPGYEQSQMQAALNPAQAQYTQNLANQGAQFGGAGQIGSARQALAGTQLAQSNELNQEQLAAQVENNIANQQLSAGSTLAQAGSTYLTGAQAAGANQLTASMAPQALYNQYAGVLFGTPASSYNANFSGTQGGITNNAGSQSTSNFSVGAQLGSASDRRLKKDIVFVRQEGRHKIYHFNYITGDERRYEGVMSDDVKEYMPDAVNVGPDGFDRVQYDMLGLEMKEVA